MFIRMFPKVTQQLLARPPPPPPKITPGRPGELRSCPPAVQKLSKASPRSGHLSATRQTLVDVGRVSVPQTWSASVQLRPYMVESGQDLASEVKIDKNVASIRQFGTSSPSALVAPLFVRSDACAETSFRPRLRTWMDETVLSLSR